MIYAVRSKYGDSTPYGVDTLPSGGRSPGAGVISICINCYNHVLSFSTFVTDIRVVPCESLP